MFSPLLSPGPCGVRGEQISNWRLFQSCRTDLTTLPRKHTYASVQVRKYFTPARKSHASVSCLRRPLNTILWERIRPLCHGRIFMLRCMSKSTQVDTFGPRPNHKYASVASIIRSHSINHIHVSIQFIVHIYVYMYICIAICMYTHFLLQFQRLHVTPSVWFDPLELYWKAFL